MTSETHKAICLIQVHFVIVHEMMKACFNQSQLMLINNHPHYFQTFYTMHLVKWVGAGSPPSEEEGKTNSLDDAGDGANGNSVERSFLCEDLCEELLHISFHNSPMI